MHTKAYTEAPSIYPQRFKLRENEIEWNQECKNYNPINFTAQIVLDQYSLNKDKGWADPENASEVARKITSYVGEVKFDTNQRPLNPKGRTGLTGRGLLGKWGPNFAGDPIVTRFNEVTQKIELLVIQRKDCLQWALPGGMVDQNETTLQAISRELKEETNLSLVFQKENLVTQDYVDDMRNTDNAWIETTAAHKEVSYKKSLEFDLCASDDAKDVVWAEVNDELYKRLYASHEKLVREALLKATN